MSLNKHGTRKICILCQNRSTVTDAQTEDVTERITYHKLPANAERRDQWLEFCGLSKESFTSFAFKFICSNHFEPECFERDLRGELLYGTKRMVLKKDSIPTIRSQIQQLKRKLDQAVSDEDERQKRKQEVEKLVNGEISSTETIVNPFRKHVCEEQTWNATPNVESNPTLLRVLPRMSESEMVQRITQLEQEACDQRKQITQLLSTINNKTEKINFAKTEMVNIAIALQELKDHENRHVNERIAQILSGRFGEGQLAVIVAESSDPAESAHLQAVWTSNELLQALQLRCISVDAYEYIRQQLHYPFPDASEISRWILSVYMQTGLNKTAMQLLKLHATALSPVELICTLNLTQTNAPVRYQYDRTRDQIVGPNAQLHCITVQGIFAAWQQIVHVDFDLVCGIEDVEKLVAELHQIGYRVAALTTGCDQVAADVWKVLSVSSDRHYIRHPVTDDSIYVYVCPDRTLTTIHRVLIEDGFVMQENNLTIAKPTLVSLLDSTESEEMYAIFERYLNIKNLHAAEPSSTFSREFISSGTSNTLKSLANDSDEGGVLSTLATLFDLFVDWHDLCMTTSDLAKLPDGQQHPITDLPYGVCEDEQNIVLDGMFDVMETVRCINPANNYLPEAILISINSIRKLLPALRAQYPDQIKSIPMQRMSSTCMDSTMQTLNNVVETLPTASKHSTNDVLFHLCQAIASSDLDAHVTNIMLRSGHLPGELVWERIAPSKERSDPDVVGVSEQDACHFLTHFVVAQLGHKYDYLGERVTRIERKMDQYSINPSSGKLTETVTPSALWIEQAKVLESYLTDVIHHRKVGLAASLIDSIHKCHPHMGRDLLELYVTKRIAIIVQELNARHYAASGQKPL
uniref:THAP-type domain-containing protein n=1 Tax=Anopheles dirus TaxID=7168 RepID=A0A182N3T4_9DIPT